ncbi:MAG: replication factor C large subunit [Thermoplasmata archaeon]|nr:replication factor C large subunit [Thermoplasmata archaeon]
MQDWTDKHRPKTLEGVIGNSDAISKLRMWAKSWENGVPKKNRAVVLIGEPGIGKTTCAHALANEMGWQVVELNASDSRNSKAINSIAGLGAMWDTFTDSGEFSSSRDGGRKLIILDEADNVFGKEDRGGIRAIGNLIVETKQPIILIVNDYYSLKRRSSIVSNRTLQIEFKRAQPASTVKLLREISKKEGVEVSTDALRAIVKRAEGDIRGAVNDLQSLAEGREEITERDVMALGGRDQKNTIFQTMAKIFRTNNCRESRDALMKLEEDPNYTILWIDENIPGSYTHDKDRMRAYDALSKADVYLGRVRRRQYYGLWKYASDMMSAGVSLSKTRKYHGYVSYRFPSWLTTMSRSKGVRETRNSIGDKLGRMTHGSRSQTLNEQLPYFRTLFTTDREFCLKMTEQLRMDEVEVGYLLGHKPDSHHVKHVFDDIEKKKKGAPAAKPKPQEKEEAEAIAKEDDEPQPDNGTEEITQKNLFDF